MHNYYRQGYTLADIVGLAREKAITYNECADILEDELWQRFTPYISANFYQRLRLKAATTEEYCERLVRVGRMLGKVEGDRAA